MYRTRKQLKDRIFELEGKLSSIGRIKRENTIIETTGLPKCKGLFCYQCAYAVFKPSEFGFDTLLLGCGKDAPCNSFTPVYDKAKVEACRSYQREMQRD